MKKKSLILLSSALLSLSALTGCGSVEDKTIDNMLEGLRNGFKLESDVNLVGVPHDDVYDKVSQTYHANYIFQNSDMVATQATIVVKEEDGSSYVAMNELLKQGEDGSGFFLDLTYENKVIETQAVDDTGAVANFGLYYGNPFSYINASDFTKVDDSTYSLSREKGSFLSSRLFGILDDIFYALIEETTFHFEGNKLSTISLKPIEIDTKLQMGYEKVDIVINATAEMKISEIGSAKVNAPTVKSHVAAHDALKTALDAVNTNYTVIVKEQVHETNLLSYSERDEYYESHFYYADENIFWRPGYLADYPEYDADSDVVLKVKENGSVIGYGLDTATNTWTTAALLANGITDVNGNTVDVYRPVVSGVAPEVFTYDETNDVYKVCGELSAFIGIDCFVPVITAPQELAGYGTDCTIKLENGVLKEIVVEFYYNNGFRERIGTITLEYSNIGTTTLPSDITLA